MEDFMELLAFIDNYYNKHKQTDSSTNTNDL